MQSFYIGVFSIDYEYISEISLLNPKETISKSRTRETLFGD